MYKDAEEFVQSCPVCQVTRKTAKPVQHLCHRTAGRLPFDVVQVDTIGPIAESEGLRYVCVLIDTYSKLTMLVPTRSTDADAAAGAILAWVGHYGIPRVIHSDGGSQYRNKLIDALMERLGSQHHVGTPYRPGSQGIVERVNAEVKRHLETLCSICRSLDGRGYYLWLSTSLIQHLWPGQAYRH
ncbi:Chromo (CHRromatin Organization MOdifier) domain [Carpediemonas membranifera]|uniref:Chromo (CHRromatin Organization MOdifier) domain n=1 Tax=Carpediemonas membranifera TaxID=201153 RepID=A0A8J6AYP6_9EUKA|nr:Chromo (CHRromatin Organization MOdifier) domain [Carpediemonas membranifera]|eukprot:KAG9391683.1 Chromo (CHRromatin Organization MOdifier) domain [Carpediemonas membranifera]